MNGDSVTYFDSFEVEYIPKEVQKFLRNKNIIANIYRIQANDSIICEYFWIGFIDFMLEGKSLVDYNHLFSLNKYKRNYKIIPKHFQWLKGLMLKVKGLCYLRCKYRKFKNLKISYIFEKTLVLSIICSKWSWKIFEEEESIEILKIIGLIKNMVEENMSRIFQFLICFFTWYSYKNHEFCNRIKNVYDNCKN